MENKFNHILCEKESKILEFQKEKNKKSLDSKSSNNLFSMVMPPPNLTGVLHIGHAWNGVVQDFIFRYQSMNGKDVIWFAGMDHAGIATQTKYESFLKSKNEYSFLEKKTREEKINLVNDWAQNNASIIRSQWQKMGLALDYENERYTLDNDSNQLVLKTFVDFYNKGLIYQGWKLVNWDVKLKTAISNIEVIKKDVNKKMFYIKYFLEDKSDFLTIATTRPETIFVDACLIANPTDKRYKKFANKKVINPLTNQLIPIIFDEYIDKSFGTGLMKCTPAHDFNDYELGKKHNLEMNSCIDYDGKMNHFAKEYESMDRFLCAKEVIKFFKKNNLLVKEEEVTSNVGFSERTNEIIEPMLSKQWFIKMKNFAKRIIDNQSSKNKLIFHPKKFEKTLLNWLKNIDDWCISRQLWWGHQIPVWYHKKTNEIYVDTIPPKDTKNWVRDNDVLDTWFSSGLWPITVTEKHSKFFPTDVLVTAYDIIFFWVVRMLSFSLNLTNKLPFKHLFITGLIRDELGRKMSKSLGNGIDPNKVIEEKGVDALRLLLLSGSSPGDDIKFSEKKLESCWGFLNKLWNSYRYIDNYKDFYKDLLDIKLLENSDKWIINRFFKLLKSFKYNVDKYNFYVGISKIMDFIKNDFCNIYIEINKQRMMKNDPILIYVLFYMMKNVLILLHPICPYISDYLYSKLPNKKEKSIIFESYNFEKRKIGSEKIIDNILLIIEYIRKLRFDNKLSKKDEFEIIISSKKNSNFIKNINEIKNILLTENIKLNKIDSLEPNENSFIMSGFSITILNKYKRNENNLDDLKKELEIVRFEIKRSLSMLNNENFIKKAPKEKIELEKEKKEKYEEKEREILKILKNFH